jgi:hypothetical protein
VIREQASIVIERPASDVWVLVSDLTTLPQWDPGASAVHLDAPAGLGTTFEIRARFLGRQRIGAARITEFEPGRTIGWRVQPPGLRALWRDSWLGATYVVDPLASEQTRLTRIFQAQAAGLLGRLVEPLVAMRARRERAAEIANVKRLLES